MLAAWSLGLRAYGIAGVNATLPECALEVFKDHRMVVALDGDEAGVEGSKLIEAQLSKVTSKIRVASLPEGKDVTDFLMDKKKQR